MPSFDPYNRWNYQGGHDDGLPGPGTVGQKIDVAEFAYRAPQFWKEPWASGAVFGRKGLGKAAKSVGAVTHGLRGLLALDVAASVAFAPRGRAVEKAAGAIGGQMTALLGGAVGMMIAGPAGAVVGAMLADPVGRNFAEHTYAAATHEGRMLRNLQTGGDYVDTPIAYTMRQRGLQELSSSLLNARQYLGQEANLLHQ